MAKCRPTVCSSNFRDKSPILAITCVRPFFKLSCAILACAAPVPNQRLWHPFAATACSITDMQGASAFKTAYPRVERPCTIAAFSRAIPSRLSKAAKCAGATVVTKAASGRTKRAKGAISPGLLMPISTTAKAASRGKLAKVKGTPQ